jgi:pilus assembly protein CpaE
MKNIRVLIVDDLAEVRQGVSAVLQLAANQSMLSLEIVAEARNGSEAVDLAQRLNPDVVLMDLEMPVMDGFEATRRIKVLCPSVKVIILSIHAGGEVLERARSAGADGFVVKGAPYPALLEAILGGKPHPFETVKGEEA